GDGSIVVAHSGAQSIKIPVNLSGKQLSNTVTVDYVITPGTATWSQKSTGGGDFGGKLSGTITFKPGATTHMIANPIWPDAGSGGEEGYTITLSTPTGGVTLIRTTGSVTLIAPPA